MASASAAEPVVRTRMIVAIALIDGSSVVRIMPQTKVESVLPAPMVSNDEIVERYGGGDQCRAHDGGGDLRQHDVPEGTERRGAEIARCLDGGEIKALQSRHQDQEHERLAHQRVAKDDDRQTQLEAQSPHHEHDD
jgi:hypothetical protein